MTTIHRITPEWAGEVVAVLASGPGLTEKVVKMLMEHKTIAVNEAIRLAPDADMLVALDGNWPKHYREFEGIKVTGVADDELDALYIGPRWETVELAPGNIVDIHNSGLTAIRIAGEMGATKIILAGFGGDGHFYDDVKEEYIGLERGIEKVTAELQARGVEVVRV